MATADAYRALTDAQLRARAQAVTAMPASAARTAELAVIRAEVERRGSSGVIPGIGDLATTFGAAIDEAHRQEDFALSLTRWGSVAIAALVLLAVVAILAWFFAPGRGIIGALASRVA